MVEYIVTSQGLHNDIEKVFKTLLEAVAHYNKTKGAYLYMRVRIL